MTAQCDLGEELCDDLTCSDVECALRDAMTADDADTTAPIITFRSSSEARLTYDDASVAATLLPCAFASDDPASCYATATDDDGTDVTPSLTVQQDTQCAGCSPASCSLSAVHQCFPDTYGFLFMANDDAGNRAVLRLRVTVVEESAVAASMTISAGSGTGWAGARSQADLLLDETSAEASAFRQ
eukprot:gene20477-24535_t